MSDPRILTAEPPLFREVPFHLIQMGYETTFTNKPGDEPGVTGTFTARVNHRRGEASIYAYVLHGNPTVLILIANLVFRAAGERLASEIAAYLKERGFRDLTEADKAEYERRWKEFELRRSPKHT